MNQGSVRWTIAWIAALATVALLGAARAQQTPDSRVEHAASEPQNWLTYYGNYSAWSYSSLTQVTRDNVKHLTPAWAFAAGFPMSNPSLRPGLEAAPLVVDG